MPSLLKNISFTFTSNLICTLISILVTFILPKGISVESYGYFQLYFFYVAYTGFLHFGWADGLFLRYGGSYYNKLDKCLFGSQFKIYCVLEILFAVIFCISTSLFVQGTQRVQVFMLIGGAISLSLPKTFLQYLLQGTNRIKEYATLITIERVVFGGLIVIIVCIGKDSFIFAITADLVGKLIALIYAIYQCREILLTKFHFTKDLLKEILSNINVGSKLMIANIASMLILGIIRWSIEQEWDVSVFGKISLTLSISNLMMVFIRAVSTIMLPTLRRIDNEKYSSIYNDIKVGLLLPMFGMLLVYYPLNSFLCFWLPNYSDSLKYMAILFPLCIFEGKLSILVETYLKTMRLEKKLLFSNIIALLFSIVITVITIKYQKNLTLAVFGILVIFAFRTSLGEYFLSKKLDISFWQKNFAELGLVFTFVFSTWFVGGCSGFVLYLSVYVLYVFFNKSAFIAALKKLHK